VIFVNRLTLFFVRSEPSSDMLIKYDRAEILYNRGNSGDTSGVPDDGQPAIAGRHNKKNKNRKRVLVPASFFASLAKK
jgi:hypothetical protein